jgi:hypothetical protein
MRPPVAREGEEACARPSPVALPRPVSARACITDDDDDHAPQRVHASLMMMMIMRHHDPYQRVHAWQLRAAPKTSSKIVKLMMVLLHAFVARRRLVHACERQRLLTGSMTVRGRASFS